MTVTAAEKDKSIPYKKHRSVFALCSYRSIVGDTFLSDAIILYLIFYTRSWQKKVAAGLF